ncbi:MAG TPA: TlpA disulfide reductase family protein [Verrucomicrobiales bacterium]|nr:TlpA disulfide reductase family protein [Verrucomicrobiales bacterium]
MNADFKPSPFAGRWRAAMLVAGCALSAGFSPALRAAEDEGGKKRPDRELPRLLFRAATPSNTRITWRNGEQLRGGLTGAEADFLIWKTPLFSEPLKLKKEAIQRIDFTNAFFRAEGSFRVVLVDGSHLTGELQMLDGKTITLASKGFGTVIIRRDQVVCLERISGSGLVVGGPMALMPDKIGGGETTVTSQNGFAVRRNSGEPEPMFFAAAGRIASPAFGLASQRSVTLPDKCVVGILVRTESIPDFSLQMSHDDAVSVETWGDELVLVKGNRFASAGVRYKENDRLIHLHLAWDRSGERCALYGPDGKLWAEIAPENKVAVSPPPEKTPEAKPSGSWLRRLFAPEEPAPPRSSSSKTNYGRAVTLTNKGGGMIIERFSVDEWTGAPPPAAVDGACVELAAEFIPGEPERLNGDVFTIRLPDGKTRDVPFAGVRAIRFPRTAKLERDATMTDLWFADGNLLHGNVMGIQQIGEKRAAVVQTAFAEAPIVAALEYCRAVVLAEPDRKGDAVPPVEKLDVINDGEFTLHGAIVLSGGLLPRFQPVGSLEAMTPAKSQNLSITRSMPADGKFERAPALLHVKTGESLPVTLKGVSREKIEYEWDAAESHEIEPAKIHAIQFSAPATVTAGFDGPGWQMTGSANGRNASRKGGSIVLQPGGGIGHSYLLQGGDISFQMARQSGPLSSMRIRLFCQGIDRASQSLNFLIGDFGSEVYCGTERTEGQLDSQRNVPSRNGVNDIRISFPGDQVELYINGARAITAGAKTKIGKKSGTGIILETASLWGNQVGSIKLSNFATQASSSIAGPPAFNDDARREALLLPRMRRDDPPRQVLIGRNGDLLRGEIEAMTSTHLSFRAGLETFKVPLDRVSAAVWVKKPDKNAAGKDGDKTGANNKRPAAPDSDGENEEDGEPVVRNRLGIAQKLAGLFAVKAAEVKVQAEAGAVAGRAVVNPETSKAAPAGDGKSDAPPSLQWLDLTNGGRLGLNVESWSGDKVIGQHPLLGHCSIPASLVYRVSVKAPPPAGALAVLADWTLVNTPDPVLPDDEGTSSPLVGKLSEDFKLPTVDGGSFALSNNRGKVVVLDFWATWCGPCVKSLPGLVEAMAAFPKDQAMFVAVNQGETKEQVKKFLEARGLDMAVAMDGDQSVARKYGVDGIPHTVVVAPDGKVAFVKTGYEPDGDKQIAEAVRKVLPKASPEKPEGAKPADPASGEPLLPAPNLK